MLIEQELLAEYEQLLISRRSQMVVHHYHCDRHGLETIYVQGEDVVLHTSDNTECD